MGTLYPQLPLQSSQNFPVPTRARANAQDLDAARLIKRLDRAIRRGLKPPHRSPRRERVVEDNEAAVQDQFNAVAYGGQIEHRVLSLRLQEVAARVSGTDEGGAQEFKTQQLTFDFFAESRAEELARFEKCTRAVARGLDGPVQENLVQVSQRVAARFSVSIKVSGAVLDGFAGGAEKLANAQEALIERFLAFVEELLGKTDDMLNDVFELLGGLFKTDGDIERSLADIISELYRMFGEAAGVPADDSFTQFAGIQLEFSFEFSAEIVVQHGEVQTSDPITLDLDDDGIELTSYANGARFDILGTGRRVKSAFVTGGDAFLAIDRNGNNIIDSGRELFGDQRGAANGFEELRKLDSNSDNVIDAADDAYAKLVLWRDDGDGQTQPDELLSLAEAQIAAISLRYAEVDYRAAGGNRIGQTASFTRTDGRQGNASDAILNYVA